jgi:uncharacterized protein YbaP (TraB family)
MGALIDRRQLIAIASASLALVATPLPASTRVAPPLYVVGQGQARAYIFGGAIPRDRSWLTPPVRVAIAESGTLWQEDLEPPPPFNRELNIELGSRPHGRLFDDLNAAQQERVQRIAKTFEYPLEMFQQMRPWAVGAVVASLDYPRHMADYKSDDVKGTILKMFKERGLPVRSEATDNDYWIRFYAGFPLPAAIQYMLYQIDLAELPRDRFPRWSAQWLRGDASGWEGFNRELAARYPDLYLELEVKRNEAWARRIEAMLAEGGTHFVFVGIQHMVGFHSIQAKLLDLGIAVQRV